MSEKEAGLIVGIIAAVGVAVYVFRDKISIPGFMYKGELTIPGTDLVNRSTLTNDVAKNVIDAYTNIVDKTEGAISHIGDLGDTIKVPEVDMDAYMDRLKDFASPTVSPVEVTQEMIDKYSRGITTTVETVKEVIIEPIEAVKEFIANTVGTKIDLRVL